MPCKSNPLCFSSLYFAAPSRGVGWQAQHDQGRPNRSLPPPIGKPRSGSAGATNISLGITGVIRAGRLRSVIGRVSLHRAGSGGAGQGIPFCSRPNTGLVEVLVVPETDSSFDVKDDTSERHSSCGN